MKYIFGTKGSSEVLKTKDKEHTNLFGFCSIKREYDDKTIYDSFLVVSKYNSITSIDGSCYDYYIIDKHYRTEDKSEQLKVYTDEKTAQDEDAICELDGLLDERIGTIEDVLCELDEMLNGGE